MPIVWTGDERSRRTRYGWFYWILVAAAIIGLIAWKVLWA
jgi:hypothetical protein